MIDECLVVEFAVTGDDCPLARGIARRRERESTASRRNSRRRLHASPIQRPRENDGLVDVLDEDDRIRYLHVSTTDGRHELPLSLETACVVHELTNAGFMAESVRYHDGNAKYTGAVVGHDVLQGVLEAAGRDGRRATRTRLPARLRGREESPSSGT